MSLTPEKRKYRRDLYHKNIAAERKRIARNKRLWRLKNIDKARKIDEKKHKKYHKRRLTYGKVKWAVRSGKIKRPKRCTRCKKVRTTYGHHPDYNKPLGVIWLCMDCHMKEHHPAVEAKQREFLDGQ